MKADIDEHAIGHSTQVLDPDAIRILTGAFDDAWQRLQASGARLESEREYKRARDILAKYIMDQARLGEESEALTPRTKRGHLQVPHHFSHCGARRARTGNRP
jgi:hypothetical protein